MNSEQFADDVAARCFFLGLPSFVRDHAIDPDLPPVAVAWPHHRIAIACFAVPGRSPRLRGIGCDVSDWHVLALVANVRATMFEIDHWLDLYVAPRLAAAERVD